ncbi:MAG: DUF58 domain-containing protein [Bacteroidales bacterium]|jgi:uncharacterized protein (DUF58 family)|nr:DUF58 domain-containing protein [Bacteroidales bacterium]MBR6279161.1 DUF58 domain-containing protein [Bacteroidales bacterium]
MLEKLSEISDLNNLEFVAAQITEGFITGLHKSPFHGFSSEFNEHSLYNKGDSTRHIDWKLYARTEKLFVKHYEDESNLRCHILIDTSSSMKYPQNAKFNKMEFSAICAAAIINLLRKQRDAVSLTLFDKNIDFSSQAKISTVHAKMLFSKLQEAIKSREITPEPETGSIAECLHRIAENIHRRSMVLIFSDMLDTSDKEDLFSGLQHLRHAKHDVILFHVMDSPTEANFNFENRPHKFIDMETGAQIALNPLDYKEIYRNLSGDFRTELKNRCSMYNIDYVEADISKTFKEILIPYLIKRAVLH